MPASGLLKTSAGERWTWSLVTHERTIGNRALRLARRRAGTITVSVNDYGFELLAERPNNRMSNESVLERLQRLRSEAERAEGGGAPT